MPKKPIRAALLAQRKHLSLDTCLHQSLLAQGQFLRLPEFAAATTLALYSPILNEVYTEEIFRQACARGKQVVYPRVEGASLEFFAVSGRDDLQVGNFGILEPKGTQPVPVARIDLLLVPGVAFDLGGHRLGYGKGYYDRLLSGRAKGAKLVGFCFEFQLLSSLPAELHDVRMDLLVTDQRTLRLGPPGGHGQALT
jgi:5-formyltetrahydrofolate cyclo-ligase